MNGNYCIACFKRKVADVPNNQGLCVRCLRIVLEADICSKANRERQAKNANQAPPKV